MKPFLFVLMLFGSFCPVISQASPNVDPSKTLLVIGETERGQEDAVIGNITTSDDNIELTRSGYRLVDVQENSITVDYFGKSYTFNRANAKESGSFRYKAIFAEQSCSTTVLGK